MEEHNPDSIPLLPRVVYVRMAAAMVFLIGLFPVLHVGSLAGPFQRPIRAGVVLFFLFLSVCGLIHVHRWNRKTSSRARQHNLRLCPKCTEPFDGDETEHTCSRCLHKFNTLHARQGWRRFVLCGKFSNTGPTPLKARDILNRWCVALLGIGVVLFFAAPIVADSMFDVSGIRTSKPVRVLSKSGKPVVLRTPVYVPPSRRTIILHVSVMAFQWLGIGIIGIYAFRAVFLIPKRTRLAAKNAFCICERCLYPLNGLSEEGHCPECGLAFQRQDLQRRWFESYARYNQKQACDMDPPVMLSEYAYLAKPT